MPTTSSTWVREEATPAGASWCAAVLRMWPPAPKAAPASSCVEDKHPSQAKRACSWMIWPSGGAGALSAAVYDWIFTLVLVLRFNRFCLFQQICNQLPAAAGGVRPQAVRTTARPYTAGRPTPPRLSSVFRRDLRSVVCQPALPPAAISIPRRRKEPARG